MRFWNALEFVGAGAVDGRKLAGGRGFRAAGILHCFGIRISSRMRFTSIVFGVGVFVAAF
jgi:hypothetical protein